MSLTLRDKLIFTIIDSRGRNDVSDAEVSYAESAADAIIDELHLTAESDEDWGAMIIIDGWWEKQ